MSIPTEDGVKIVSVRSAAHILQTRELFLKYAATPGIGESLAIQRFQNELATLPAQYVPPAGELLLALDCDGQPVGCVALRPLPHDSVLSNGERSWEQRSNGTLGSERSENIETALTNGRESPTASPPVSFCELKRLYVLPSHQSLGVGRALVSAALPIARKLGYDEVRLDTLRWMRAAIRLYEQFGFRRIDAYHERWGGGEEELLYFGKALR